MTAFIGKAADFVVLMGVPILCIIMYLANRDVEGTILLAAQFIVRGLKEHAADETGTGAHRPVRR